MENQNNQKNQRKALIALILTVVIGIIIGISFAYFQSSASIENTFQTGTYRVVTTETFESPTNWMPGETVSKSVATTNEGTVNAAVRVSYTEAWYDSNNNLLSPQPSNVVTINLANTNDWEHEGNYYYYKHVLSNNDTTSSFMSGVTLNSSIGSSDVTCTPSNNGQTQTCETTSPVAGKTYKLTITTETVQADSYQDVWNTQVVIQ